MQTNFTGILNIWFISTEDLFKYLVNGDKKAKAKNNQDEESDDENDEDSSDDEDDNDEDNSEEASDSFVDTRE